MDKKAKDRASIAIVMVSVLIIWVLVNSQLQTFAVVVYLVMGSFCLFLYSQWGNFGKVSDLEGLDDNWGINALIGFGLGIVTIILGNFFSFIGAIGIPPVQSIAGTLGKFIIIVPVASLFEEIFFRDFLQDLLESKLGLPKYLTTGIVAASFSVFHLVAYGNSLKAAGGSFFSAALMGFIFGVITEKRNSLASSIAYHGTLNSWLGFIKLNVIVG